MTSSDSSNIRRHAVIAGTGRAGTTFLVEFLRDCGIEVGETTAYSDRANAGFESSVLDAEAPYLTKDPWFYTYCHDIDLTTRPIDVVIVPVRSLAESAESRLVQERANVLEHVAPYRSMANEYGVISGGSIYSLEPIDLQRILAVGFYQVIQWAVRNEVPVVLLDFPRLANDRDYLITQLWPWLSNFCTREVAETSFAKNADPSKSVLGNASKTEATPTDFKALRILYEEERARRSEGEQTIKELRAAEQKVTHELALVKNSKSWRITAPLRKFLR